MKNTTSMAHLKGLGLDCTHSPRVASERERGREPSEMRRDESTINVAIPTEISIDLPIFAKIYRTIETHWKSKQLFFCISRVLWKIKILCFGVESREDNMKFINSLIFVVLLPSRIFLPSEFLKPRSRTPPPRHFWRSIDFYRQSTEFINTHQPIIGFPVWQHCVWQWAQCDVLGPLF